MPQISVIITTHNRPYLLPRAIKSAQAAGSEVEVIVVDDASTDETAEVCRRFPEVRYIRVERNRRVAGARNIGILASMGDYLSFLDDDDWRLPHSLDAQLKILEGAPEAGFAYGKVLICDQHGILERNSIPSRFPQGDIFWPLLERNFIPCGSVVFRKACLYHVGLLNESIPGIDDWDLWIRLAEIYRVVAVEQAVAVWRRPTTFSGQASSTKVDLIGLGAKQLRQRWLALPRAAKASPRKRRETWFRFSSNVAEHLLWEAASAFAKGDLPYAGKSALGALTLHPSAHLRIARRWVRPSTLRTLIDGVVRNKMQSTKQYLKQARSSE